VEGPTLDLHMDIVECALGNFAGAVGLGMDVVVLLNRHVVSGHSCNPGYMASVSGIGLCNTSWDRLVVNADASVACGFVPGIRITPVVAFIFVGEVDAETLVDAPGDEAGTLALEVRPFVDRAAGTLVWVVVGYRARDLPRARGAATPRALACHIAIRARLDIVVCDVALVGGLVPDVISADIST